MHEPSKSSPPCLLTRFFCLVVYVYKHDTDMIISCFVRARRLNVIIQPHLRFAYELLKLEETRCTKKGLPFKREFEWATIAREIALMNKPYCR